MQTHEKSDNLNYRMSVFNSAYNGKNTFQRNQNWNGNLLRSSSYEANVSNVSVKVLNDKVDFCKVAEGLGCMAIKVTTKEEVAPAIEKAVNFGGPVVIECIIHEDDKVFPMVAPGTPNSAVFDEKDLEEKN